MARYEHQSHLPWVKSHLPCNHPVDLARWIISNFLAKTDFKPTSHQKGCLLTDAIFIIKFLTFCRVIWWPRIGCNRPLLRRISWGNIFYKLSNVSNNSSSSNNNSSSSSNSNSNSSLKEGCWACWTRVQHRSSSAWTVLNRSKVKPSTNLTSTKVEMCLHVSENEFLWILLKDTWKFTQKPGKILGNSWNFVTSEKWEPWEDKYGCFDLKGQKVTGPLHS